MMPIRERASPELWVEKDSPDPNSFGADTEDGERGVQRKMIKMVLRP